MELTPSETAALQLKFENFFKKILREAAIDYDRQLYYRSGHETVFSETPDYIIDNLFTNDEYPVLNHFFNVLAESIFVKDDRLADALRILPKEKRDIILLSYYIEMTDSTIGTTLNMVRQTVQSKRKSTLEELRKEMEKKEDEKKDKEK